MISQRVALVYQICFKSVLSATLKRLSVVFQTIVVLWSPGEFYKFYKYI